jgi:hypothetical protein
VSLTVVCLWIQRKGKQAYTVEYVERLRNMVARHLSIPHRFVCMTNTPERLPPDIEGIPVKGVGGLRPWWLKLKLFSNSMRWSGRLLYLDLDVLVVGSLDEIANFPTSFALLPDMAPDYDGSTFAPWLKVNHRYNSSVMVLDAGAKPQLWSDWHWLIGYRLRSDQDWIAERCPNEATFPKEWFARLKIHTKPPFDPPLKVLLAIKIKNQMADRLFPWFREYWR